MDQPLTTLRRSIDGKDYSCSKLPYRKARPLQLRLAATLAPLLSVASANGEMDIQKAIPLLAGSLGEDGADIIIELCETCMVDGARVSVDSFNADESTDIKVAALALETHFANFIKGLRGGLGDLVPKGILTKS